MKDLINSRISKHKEKIKEINKKLDNPKLTIFNALDLGYKRKNLKDLISELKWVLKNITYDA